MSAPWFVGGGAKHSPETARLLANAATGDAQGIVAPGDYKVRPLAVPGASVRVAPGAATLRAEPYVGGRSQSYMTRRAAETVLPVTATGSASGRSDLVVQRIDDPQFSGTLSPTDPASVFDPFVIIPGVPAGTTRASQLNLGYPAVELARIDLPVSTGTVEATHIKDLRKLARPRRQREVRTYFPTGNEDGPSAAMGRSLWPFMQLPVDCPTWATHVHIVVTLGQIMYVNGSLTGHSRIEYGWNNDNPNTLAGQDSGHHHVSSATERQSIPVAADLAIPTSYRGKMHYVRIGTVLNSGSVGYFRADVWSSIVVDVEFVERAV